MNGFLGVFFLSQNNIAHNGGFELNGAKMKTCWVVGSGKNN